VQAGENLFRIALQYGLTTEQLAAANGITNAAVISVGTVLTIPGCQSGPAVVVPPDTTTGNASSGSTHVVQEGENLYRIALQYGLTWQQLAEANGITNPDSVFVGQILNIP
jgi:LysM repeat protein